MNVIRFTHHRYEKYNIIKFDIIVLFSIIVIKTFIVFLCVHFWIQTKNNWQMCFHFDLTCLDFMHWIFSWNLLIVVNQFFLLENAWIQYQPEFSDKKQSFAILRIFSFSLFIPNEKSIHPTKSLWSDFDENRRFVVSSCHIKDISIIIKK